MDRTQVQHLESLGFARWKSYFPCLTMLSCMHYAVCLCACIHYAVCCMFCMRCACILYAVKLISPDPQAVIDLGYLVVLKTCPPTPTSMPFPPMRTCFPPDSFFWGVLKPRVAHPIIPIHYYLSSQPGHLLCIYYSSPSTHYSSAHLRSRSGISFPAFARVPSTSSRHAQYSPNRISAYAA